MRLASCFVVVCLLVGCSGPRVVSLRPQPKITPEDYDAILERWTRTDKVYDVLDAKLFVHSTFHSPEFRAAFLIRHQTVYGRGSEVARRLALTSEGAEDSIEFFFSAWTPDVKWNDFSEPDSIWRVTLEGDDGVPVDGKVLRLKPTANLRVIYPYISEWAKTYAVRFPRTNDRGQAVITAASKWFRVKITSALGQAILEWQLAPAVPPPPPAG